MSAAKSEERFSNRVAGYVRYRPRYPEAVVRLLAERIGLSPAWKVADLGSGTGFSAEPFLRYGNSVFGVEPNAAMREAAETLLAEFPGFQSIAGSAEATTLAPESVDLIVAAQAFHWFDLPKTKTECRRILRPGGWVALLWNSRRTQAAPFMQAYEDFLREFGTDYCQVRHENIDGEILNQFFQPGFRLEVLENKQDFDLAGLKGRVLSSSYMPTEGDPNYKPMLDHLERLFHDHAIDGQVEFPYDLQVYWGKP